MIPWLEEHSPFPPVSQALSEPNGLLAAGGDLSLNRLIQAYQSGIFPWFSQNEPLLWWSPNPRMVLKPSEFKLSRSLRKKIQQQKFNIRIDTHFTEVMLACSQPRNGHIGTWIDEAMIRAYSQLHQHGLAHSVETWIDGQLAGGLYGVSIGRMFFGESMFTLQPDASKIALAHLARQLHRWGFRQIDCQMKTPHLSSLGAQEIDRTQFLTELKELVNCDPPPSWQFDDDLFN